MLKSQYTIPSILKTTEDNKKTKINVKKIKSIKKKIVPTPLSLLI